MGKFYVGNDTIMGGGVGEVKTAAVANALPDSVGNRVLERYETTIGKNLSGVGWYRIARTKSPSKYSTKGGILIFGTTYHTSKSEEYNLSFNVQTDNYSCTQLSGIHDSTWQRLTKVRFYRSNENQYWYIDVYKNIPSSDEIYVCGIGGIVSLTPALATDLDNYTYGEELTLVSGFKQLK